MENVMRLLNSNLQQRRVVTGILAVTAALAVALLSACNSGAALNPDPSTLQALSLALDGFAEHVGQRTEIYVADRSNKLWFAGVYDPLPAASLSVSLPNSLSTRQTYNCSIWIDENGNGIHDNYPTDPNWVMPIDANGMFSMMHNDNDTNFNPVFFNRGDRTGDFRFNVTGGMDAGDVGMSFEVRVIDLSTGRTIGLYHLGAIPAETFSVGIPKIIKPSTYQVDFYMDENGNGQYDAPPVDHAWRRTITLTGSDDLTVNFVHDMDYTDIGF
jgi:hypothetical protein